jgi:WXG100 family type VII secretion target
VSEPSIVGHATLHTVAADVRAAQGRIDGKLDQLWSVVAELEATWQGVSGDGLQALMRRWNGDVTKLLGAMAHMADLLDKTANAHQATDEQQQAMIDRFHSALSGF